MLFVNFHSTFFLGLALIYANIKLLLLKILQKIPIKLCPRRPGDATAVYASTEKAQEELGWKYVYNPIFFQKEFPITVQDRSF